MGHRTPVIYVKNVKIASHICAEKKYSKMSILVSHIILLIFGSSYKTTFVVYLHFSSNTNLRLPKKSSVFETESTFESGIDTADQREELQNSERPFLDL